MRIFHLADLHLGKSLYERDLTEDQRHALSAVVDAARLEKPAAVVIAGDVFDRAVPSAEAVTLLGRFVAELKAIDGQLVVAMIPGNHDSAARLAYLAPVLETAGVYVASDPADCDRPVIVERGGETVRLWLLPFLTPGAFGRAALPSVPGAGAAAVTDGMPADASQTPSADSGVRPAPADSPRQAPAPSSGPAPANTQGELFGDEAGPELKPAAETGAEPAEETEAEAAAEPEQAPALRSQADLFAEGVRRILAAMDRLYAGIAGAGEGAAAGGRTMDVLVCHAFAAGGASSESERAFLGTAELVDASAFDRFDYVALGHLHSPQPVGARGRYPGSMLAYSFSEGDRERGFLSVRLSSQAPEAEFRAVQPKRRMIRVEGTFDQVLVDPALEAFKDDYVEAVLDDATAVLNPMDALRRKFPFIMSLRQAAFERGVAADGSGAAAGRAPATVAEDFAAFHRDMLGSDPDGPTSALFAELYEEARCEAP